MVFKDSERRETEFPEAFPLIWCSLQTGALASVLLPCGLRVGAGGGNPPTLWFRQEVSRVPTGYQLSFPSALALPQIHPIADAVWQTECPLYLGP